MILYDFLSTLSGAAAHTAASYEIAMCSAPRCLENIILLTSDEYEAHCGRHFNVWCGGAGNIQEKLAANYAQDGAKMAILAPLGKPGLTRRPQDPANLALLGMLLATTLPNKRPRWRQDNQLVKFMAPSGRKLPPTWYWVGPSWHFLGCSLLDFAIHYLG